MYDFIEQISSPWAIRALLASSMVGITCGVLGAFIVLRNMSLIGDALAHAILPGIFVSFVLVGYNVVGFFIGSVVAGVTTSFGITWIQQYVKTKNDAAIGIVFSSMFALGVMGISKVSRKGVHLDLTDFLFGEILGIGNTDILLSFGVMVLVVGSVILFYRSLFITTFQETIAKTMGIKIKWIHYFLMFLLSFAVVSALSSVGVILVVAMLITPAATALLLAKRLKHVLILSSLLGLLGAVIGMIIAIIADTNPGPAMALTVTTFYITVVFFSPSKGLVFKYFRKRRAADKVELEDILKYSIKQGKEKSLDLDTIAKKLGIPLVRIQKRVQSMFRKELIRKEGTDYYMTEAGIQQGNHLLRAHRLWESYLVERIGLGENEIHDDAELKEHDLTPAMLDEVEASLGYPDTDPHGSPIPKSAPLILSKAALNRNYMFVKAQKSNDIDAALWDMGILPNQPFKVIRKNSSTVEILYNNRKYRLDWDIANQALVR